MHFLPTLMTSRPFLATAAIVCVCSMGFTTSSVTASTVGAPIDAEVIEFLTTEH